MKNISKNYDKGYIEGFKKAIFGKDIEYAKGFMKGYELAVKKYIKAIK